MKAYTDIATILLMKFRQQRVPVLTPASENSGESNLESPTSEEPSQSSQSCSSDSVQSSTSCTTYPADSFTQTLKMACVVSGCDGCLMLSKRFVAGVENPIMEVQCSYKTMTNCRPPATVAIFGGVCKTECGKIIKVIFVLCISITDHAVHSLTRLLRDTMMTLRSGSMPVVLRSHLMMLWWPISWIASTAVEDLRSTTLRRLFWSGASLTKRTLTNAFCLLLKMISLSKQRQTTSAARREPFRRRLNFDLCTSVLTSTLYHYCCGEFLSFLKLFSDYTILHCHTTLTIQYRTVSGHSESHRRYNEVKKNFKNTQVLCEFCANRVRAGC